MKVVALAVVAQAVWGMAVQLCPDRPRAVLAILAALLCLALPSAAGQLAGDAAMLRLGILVVLLTPCIDYVITFAQLGRADARLLLASTPILLLVQLVLLPFYLNVLLGKETARLVRMGLFLHASLWLIVLPLILEGLVQLWAARSPKGQTVGRCLGLLPVPATALVLILVVSATVPVLDAAVEQALSALPIYIAFAVVASLVGWFSALAFGLKTESARAVAFSSATRNSLVVLPVTLAVPGAIPVIPPVIVTQTLVEPVAELDYIRLMPPILSRVADQSGSNQK